MSWIKPIIKGLAMAAVPVKIIDKGLDHAKNEIREEIGHYEVKVKKMMLVGASFMLMLIFFSAALALALGNWLDSPAAGFAIISGIFLVIFLAFLVAFKDRLSDD